MKAAVIIALLTASVTATPLEPYGVLESRGGWKWKWPWWGPQHPKPHSPHHGHPHDDGKCKNKPFVNSKKLQKSIEADALLEGAKTLQELAYSYPQRNRLAGSSAHNDTIEYLVKTLNSFGGYYTVEKQEFALLVQTNGTGSLEIDGAPTEFGMFDYSATGTVTGPLVVVSNFGCDASDFPAGVSGNIALISRGTCEFGIKSANAGVAGAIGALIYNNIPGVIDGTLGAIPREQGPYLPTLGLSQELGLQLVESIDGGATHTAHLDVLTFIEESASANVLATSKCGNHGTTLMLGAHTDSVAAGPGINDDGSGTIGILEVAKYLADYKINNAVRFGFWSGEEEGSLGSDLYVDSLSEDELADVRAYLNFDMIASPNYYYAFYDGDGSTFNETGPTGSAEIEHFFEEYFASIGQNFTATAFDGRSDYAGFIAYDIPAGGVFTGAEGIKTEEEAAMFGGEAGVAYDVNYHGAGDTIDNLAMDAFLINTKAIAASVAAYATSFKSLPSKSPNVKKRDAVGSKLKNHARKGRKLAR